MDKAQSHILSTQDESGGWSRLKGEFPYETEPTSWAVKVLSMNRTGADKIEKGVRFILQDQKPDGSWNNNAAHTAFAIIALSETGEGPEAVKKAIAYLKGAEQNGGGFQRVAGVGEPTTLHTASALFAFKAAGLDPDEPSVKKAVGWLKGSQNEDGGYGMFRGSPSTALGTTRSLTALRMYLVKSSEPYVAHGIAWLLSTRKESGGFSMMPASVEDPEITAYVIMALNGLTEYRKYLDNALDYLEGAQQADGSYTSATPIQFDNKPKKNTQTACFVAWALLEMK
ncbi:MAG TPA: prenyltransferase/squalene oxidase repeat-containing protein [Syntrophorhabdaceae bacterium]|nr:prenyltransferase/squalene oxidase repeat-containing protein [Syntrophorhabdaceae bacterium]